MFKNNEVSKKNLLASFLWISAVLAGCSAEDNSSAKDKQEGAKQTAAPNIQPAKPLAEHKDLGSAEDKDANTLAPPTRSELRVMSEDAKATEDQVKEVIEQFDANLDDREQRKLAQAKFKQMLPEYKENMLKIGKAQLTQEK
jgi:hypothetical protein